jgi:hypothetical protein
MSRDADDAQDGPSTPGPRDSRRRSLWNLPIATASSSFAHGAQAIPESPSTPLNLRDVIREGLPLGDTPEHARSWLCSYGDFQPGTEVSRKFLGLRRDHHDDQGATTVLSLLTGWIPIWSQKVFKARKDSKGQKQGPQKEQNNLDWLLRYINDFLKFGHMDFDPLELSRTVDAMINLCLASSRQSEINDGIDILHTIASRFSYPESVLEQTLVVLCASAANLPELPPRLYDCGKLLAGGKLSQQVVTTLYAFLLTPTAENNHKNLSHARGAARLLRILVPETRTDNSSPVVDISTLIEQLHLAAQARIFRFCHDILSCEHAALSCEDRRGEAAVQDYNLVLDIIRICLDAQPTRSMLTEVDRVNSPQVAAQDEDQSSKQVERHMKDRENDAKKLAQDFANLWTLLDQQARNAIMEFLLARPTLAGEDQLTVVLQHVKEEFLSSADQYTRRRYAEKVFDEIVENDTLVSSCRLKGVEVLVQSSNAWPDPNFGMDEAHHSEYVTIFHRLLDQIDVEHDAKVIETLLKSLDYMASNYHEAAKEPESAARTIEKLHSLIIRGSSNLDFNDEHVVLTATVLVTIFNHCLHTNAKAAIQAFQALLEVSSSRCKSTRARLVAKRILFRLRADDAGFIYVADAQESLSLAPALVRTQESFDVFNVDTTTSPRQSASSPSLTTRSAEHSPLWLYPNTEDIIFPFTNQTSSLVNVNSNREQKVFVEIDIDKWLVSIISCLQTDQNWETYSYTVIHLGAQLSNIALWLNSIHTVTKLRQVLCEQIVNNSFREPPPDSGLKKSDIALCIYDILVNLIPYATIKSGDVQKGFGQDLVRAFIAGIGGTWEGTSRICIHALSVCSIEIPSSVASLYPTIFDKMSKNMTQSHLTTHILEFLIQVALLPEMHSKLNPDEVQIIFSLCIQFLEKSREQQQQSSLMSPPSRINPVSRHSGIISRRPPYRAAMLTDTGVPQYASALAYHNILYWFLALPLALRFKYVEWIIPRLVWKNASGDETIDEQGEVLIDMMQRTAFSDLGETSPLKDFATEEDGPVKSTSWIAGLSIVTAETAGNSGKTLITKRQASGTTYAMYQQLTADQPSHQRPGNTEIRHETATTEMLPPHVMLQMVATAASTTLADQPLLLPKEDYVQRALEGFDRVPTVTSHKIGVLYIGPGQSEEAHYLPNTTASRDFGRLLRGLGYQVSLKPPLRFNPQGLTHPEDGEHTIAWRDRVEEIIYFVPTLMPADDEDPQCIAKKRHVGNCHVNIVFNRSDKEWDFDNFKSQLNYVNIVITPACRGREDQKPEFMPGFYSVQLITKEGMPKISPAGDPKMISAEQLATFVRTLALNANFFCQTWNTKDEDVEFPSNWRARLQQIKKLKERVSAKAAEKQALGTGSSILTSTPGGRRTPITRDEPSGSRRDSVLAAQLDFSRWTS